MVVQTRFELTEVLEANIARHLAEAHGMALDVERDVALGPNPPDSAFIDIAMATPLQEARFWCDRCRNGNFPVGDPVYGPERTSILRARHRELDRLLRSAPPEEWDEIARAYDRGELAEERLATWRSRQAKQTAVRSSPGHERCLERCWSYLIWRYEERGTQEQAIQDLVDLHAKDLQWYAEIVGDTWLKRPGTFADYLKQVPAQIKRAAKQTFLDRKAAERDRRRRR